MSTDTLLSETALSSSIPLGFTAMFKQPDEPWRFINALLEGKPPQGDDELLRVLQALVGGYIDVIGRPTEGLPYCLVCNEDGHGLSMSRNVDLRGGMSLVGPVLLIRYEHGEDGWTDVNMSMDEGADPHVEALRRLLGMPLHPDDIKADQLLTVDVTTTDNAKVEAVHA